MKFHLLFAFALLGHFTLASFGAENYPSPPLADAAAKEAPGLNLTITAAGQTDAHPVRIAALYVPVGQPASPFLAAGPFTARFEGSIQSPLRAEVSFAADLAGALKMTVNGEEVLAGSKTTAARLEAAPARGVKLSKGANKIVVEYTSPEKGDALFRLIWSSREFPAEPVPPTVLMRDPSLAPSRMGERARDGRLLFAQLRCGACHDAAGLAPAKGEGMPELAQDAPIFADFGARFNEAWLAHWVNDPHAIRPQTPMPRIFRGAGEGIDQRAADVAAYLATLGTHGEAPEAPNEEMIPLGGALFANLGCIACHTTPEYDGTDEFNRVPLGHLKAKWQPAALLDYLKDPQKYYQWTRMPNFRLTDEEAARLTAFLLAGNQKEFPAGPKGDPVKGGQLVVSAGCLNCHAGLPPTTAPKLADTLKNKWERGCLAPDDKTRGAAPDFHLTAAQRDSLRALGAIGFASLKQDTPAEYSQRQAANLRCNACHAIDASASTWSQLENDIAPLQAGAPTPEGEGQALAGPNAPPFTWFGEKLRPGYAAEFIAGKMKVKPRPWLIARMPSFATYAAPMAAGLSHQHGFSAVDPRWTTCR